MTFSQCGSSPLTRGKQPLDLMRYLIRRLIPAHAGKTLGVCSWRSCRWAHPRSRGENPMIASRSPSVVGSSPLTRGKRWGAPRNATHRRLIPAHAGKTGSRRRFGRWCRAHPRSRGENRVPRRRRDRDHGSSPLTRGKPSRVSTNVFMIGLIPAHAGKTSPTRRRAPTDSAHPRSRGENAGLYPQRPLRGGSSPLTRGKLSLAASRAD